MKKIILFIIGLICIPPILGYLTTYMSNNPECEVYTGFWGVLYLFIYILFPLLYKGKIKQAMNRYAFYALLYGILFLIINILLICFN